MIVRCVVLVALLAPLVAPAATATEFGSPPPNLLFQLQRQNRAQPMLHVTLDTTRVTLRAARLDESGLSGIEVPAYQAPPPDPIAWRSIARIDVIESGAKTWGIIGFVVGGGLGLALGTALGESQRTPYTDSNGNTYTTGQGGTVGLLGLAVLGGLGAWQGSRFGARNTHDRVWYVAAPLIAPASASSPPAVEKRPMSAAPDSTIAAAPPQTPSAAVPPPANDSLGARLAESRGVRRVVARVDPNDLIRMRGDFGQFQGHLSVVGPFGVEGLNPDRGSERYQRGSAPTGLIGWDRIDHVEKRGNGAGRGALIGGLSCGLLGGLLGVAVNEGFGGEAEPAAAAVGGGAVMGGIGLVLGGLIGAAFPAWHVVYDGP